MTVCLKMYVESDSPFRPLLLKVACGGSAWNRQHQYPFNTNISRSISTSVSHAESLAHLILLDWNLHPSPIPRGVPQSFILRSSALGHQSHMEDFLELRWSGPTPTVMILQFWGVPKNLFLVHSGELLGFPGITLRTNGTPASQRGKSPNPSRKVIYIYICFF